MAKKLDFEKMTLNLVVERRGGGIEIDLCKIDKKYKGEKMTAYQNYLGGDMLGRVANSCTIIDWGSDAKLYEIGLELRKHFFGLTSEYSDLAFKINQSLSVSAY